MDNNRFEDKASSVASDPWPQSVLLPLTPKPRLRGWRPKQLRRQARFMIRPETRCAARQLPSPGRLNGNLRSLCWPSDYSAALWDFCWRDVEISVATHAVRQSGGSGRDRNRRQR
jgi:hypothetical protein